MTNAEKERQQAGLCILADCPNERLALGGLSGYRSRFCKVHYRMHDKRSRHAPPPLTLDTETVLATLNRNHPPREIPAYVHPPVIVRADVRDQRGFADTLAWSDMLIVAKGGRVRAPHAMDDAERAAAYARLDVLVAARLGETA